MPPEERLARTEANLDRLTIVVDTLASTVVAHDNQIEALIIATNNLKVTTQELKDATEKQSAQIADMARQWQAYINTLPRQ